MSDLFFSKITALLLLSLSGLALVLAFPPFNQQGLIWIAFIPALLATHYSPFFRKHSFLAGYFLGLIYFGGVFWWIGYVTVLGTTALVFYLALYPGIWLWIVTCYGSRFHVDLKPNLLFSIFGASCWVVLEWFRGWFLTGFNWNNLGIALHQNIPLIQWACIGGVYFLSWWIIFVNILVARNFERIQLGFSSRNLKRPFDESLIALGLIALLFAWGLHRALAPWPLDGKKIRVACVQPNVPQNAYNPEMSDEEILRRHYDLTKLALLAKPDLLVWPEATTGLNVFNDDSLSSLVEKIQRDNHCYFLLGGQDIVSEKMYNSAFIFPPAKGDLQVYHKNKLVIFGEYTPLVNYLPMMRRLVPFSTDFSSGNSAGLMDLASLGIKITPLICFEDTLSDFVRQGTAMGSDLLVNVTNDSWFYQSPGAEQHLANAIFRTVETGRPMLRCGNTGITCFINARGVIAKNLKPMVEGVFVDDITILPPVQTFYQHFGDWIVLLSGFICLGSGLALWKKVF